MNFLEDSEKSGIFSETLEEQYQIIKQETDKSHVMQWGDMSFKTDKVAEYISYRKGITFKNGIPTMNELRRNGREKIERVNMNSRTVKMQSLMEINLR